MLAVLCIAAPSLAMFSPGFARGFGLYGCGPWGGFPGCLPYGYGGYPGYNSLNVGNEGLNICISLPGIGSISMGQVASGLSAASAG